MRRKIFICFLVVFISTVVLCSIRRDKLRASGSNVDLKSSKSTTYKDAVVKNREGNGMTGKSNLEKAKEYRALLEKFSKSNYKVVKGKVIRESKQFASSSIEEKEIKIINNALDAIKGKISIPEEAKVLIQSEENRYIVIFENKLPKGTMGADYSAKVTIDSESGKILEILGGS